MAIWKELKKVVNSNFNKPLNEQLIDREFYEGQLITSSTTWTVPKTGIYKIICVGAGEDGSASYGGGASGGVVVEKARLTEGASYSITIGNNALFGTLCSAIGASNGTGGSGTVTNGKVYAGQNANNTSNHIGNGADVSFFDSKYMSKAIQTITQANTPMLYFAPGGTGLFGGQQGLKLSSTSTTGYAASGGGGYGAGGGLTGSSSSSYTIGVGGAACIYIELIQEI